MKSDAMAAIATPDPAARQDRAAPDKEGGYRSHLALLLGAAAVAAYIFLRLRGLVSSDLNGAETFLVDGIRMPTWRAMLDYMIADMVHPPGPYLLLIGWIAIGGESLLWVKLLSATAAIAALVPFVLLCRELGLRARETNVALLIAAPNAYLIHHAQEMRMYSLLLLGAMCSAWLFMRHVNSPRRGAATLVPLTIANVLLVYTHYFGGLLVASQLVVLLAADRRRIRGFLASIATVAVAFAPWALLVTLHRSEVGSNTTWIPRPSPHTVAEFFGSLHGLRVWPGTARLGLLLFGIPLLLFVVQLARGRIATGAQRIGLWFLVAASLGTHVAAFAASRVLPDSFWNDRYFIFMAMIHMILIAVAVWRIAPPAVGRILAACIVAWATAAGLYDIHTQRYATDELASRVRWSDLAGHIATAENARAAEQPVTFYSTQIWVGNRYSGDWTISTSLAFHLQEAGFSSFRFRPARSAEWLLADNPPDRFWLTVLESPDGTSPIALDALAQAGYQLSHEATTSAGRNRIVLLHATRATDVGDVN